MYDNNNCDIGIIELIPNSHFVPSFLHARQAKLNMTYFLIGKNYVLFIIFIRFFLHFFLYPFQVFSLLFALNLTCIICSWNIFQWPMSDGRSSFRFVHRNAIHNSHHVKHCTLYTGTAFIVMRIFFSISSGSWIFSVENKWNEGKKEIVIAFGRIV